MKILMPSLFVEITILALKYRILAIKAIFDPKNQFLTTSIDDRIDIEVEITSFNIIWYMYVIKVAVALASCDLQKCKLCVVTGAEGFRFAELWVRQLKIDRKSCFAILIWVQYSKPNLLIQNDLALVWGIYQGMTRDVR